MTYEVRCTYHIADPPPGHWRPETKTVLEDKLFASRTEAERFAARRSIFVYGIVTVNPRGKEGWSSVYRNGWLKDTHHEDSWKPERQTQQEEIDRRVGSRIIALNEASDFWFDEFTPANCQENP